MNHPRLAARARLRWDRVGGRHLLLYPERGLALSDSAAAILKLCDGVRSVDDIVDEIARTHSDSDAHAENIAHDVAAFLDEMRRRGLVEWG